MYQKQFIKKSSEFLFDTQGSLKQKVIRSSFWILFLKLISKLIGLVRNIILARILLPSDFGLIGMALISMAFLETITTSGFETALIQKKEGSKQFLDTAWTVNLIRGFLLAITLFFCSPLIAGFFANPMLEPILKVSSLSILLYGLTNIGIIYFQKELDFKKQFIYEFVGIIAEFSVAVTLAIIYKNVWALVFAIIAGNLIRVITSYLIHPYKPRLELDFSKIKKLFGFGKWILGTNIFSYFLLQGDDILVGKILGSSYLGLYQMAYRLSNLPATQITQVIMQVSFPAFARLQQQTEKLKNIYFRFIQFSSFLLLPLSFLIMLLAYDFVFIFLGEIWLPMVPAVYFLSLWGILRSYSGCAGILFQAIGKPQIESKMQFLRLILMIGLVIPFTLQWQIVGTSLAVFLAGLIVLPLSLGFVASILKTTLWKLLDLAKVPFISSLIMALGLVIIKKLILTGVNLPGFFLSVVIGLALYSASVYVLDIIFQTQVIILVRNQLKKFSQNG